MTKKNQIRPSANVPFAMPDWPASKVEMWPISRIKPYPHNARTHSDEQIALLARSMTDEGVTMPILVDEGGVIIAGHGRRAGPSKRQRHLLKTGCVVCRSWPTKSVPSFDRTGTTARLLVSALTGALGAAVNAGTPLSVA